MGVLVACENKEDPIKNEGDRVFTTLFIAFSDPIKNEGARVVTILSINF